MISVFRHLTYDTARHNMSVMKTSTQFSSTCISCTKMGRTTSQLDCPTCSRRRVFVAGLDMLDLVYGDVLENRLSVGAALAVVSDRYGLTADELCAVNEEWNEVEDEYRSIDWEHGDDYVALEHRAMLAGVPVRY